MLVVVFVVVVLEMVVIVQTLTPSTLMMHGVVVVTMGVGSVTTWVTTEVTRLTADETPDDAAEPAAGLPLPRIPGGVWWALAGAAAGFGAGFVVGRSQK